MTDYISRQAAKQMLCNITCGASKPCMAEYDCITTEQFETIPAADVVEVVRCRDCKYWDGEIRDGFYYFEHCSLINEDRISDDYCSYGEVADK